MANILCIDTATKACSAALMRDGIAVASRCINRDQYSHAESLHVLIQEMLAELDWPASKLDAVAVSAGPGSYTGLRIGVSAAKGLCFGLEVPLIAIETLRLLCQHERVVQSGADLFCPMIDARRNEVYTAMYSADGEELRPTEALILDNHTYSEVLATHKVAFFGDGSEKFEEQLKHPNALFLSEIIPAARFMGGLAEAYFRQKRFEDVAYFVPAYLKEYIAGKPKKKATVSGGKT